MTEVELLQYAVNLAKENVEQGVERLVYWWLKMGR